MGDPLIGSCNRNPARRRDRQAAGVALPEAAGIPFIQYLMCRKVASTGAGLTAPGMVTFFGDIDDCPNGWSRNADLEGHLLVGLPADATEQAAFGGGPLENGEMRPYHHWADYKHYDYDGDFGNDYLLIPDNPDARPYGGPPYIQSLACTKD